MCNIICTGALWTRCLFSFHQCQPLEIIYWYRTFEIRHHCLLLVNIHRNLCTTWPALFRETAKQTACCQLSSWPAWPCDFVRQRNLAETCAQAWPGRQLRSPPLSTLPRPVFRLPAALPVICDRPASCGHETPPITKCIHALSLVLHPVFPLRSDYVDTFSDANRTYFSSPGAAKWRARLSSCCGFGAVVRHHESLELEWWPGLRPTLAQPQLSDWEPMAPPNLAEALSALSHSLIAQKLYIFGLLA